MPDEVGTRGVNSSIIIPSTSNGTKQRTRSILDRIPPNRRRDPNESKGLRTTSYILVMDHLVCAEGISNRRPLSGVVSADDLRPFDERPCLLFSPCRSTVSPPTETWRRPPNPGPWISLGSRMAPPSSLIGGRWGTVCSTLLLFSGLCPVLLLVRDSVALLRMGTYCVYWFGYVSSTGRDGAFHCFVGKRNGLSKNGRACDSCGPRIVALLPRTDDKAEMGRFNAAGKIRPRSRPSVASPSRSPIRVDCPCHASLSTATFWGQAPAMLPRPLFPSRAMVALWVAWTQVPQLEATTVPQAPAVRPRVDTTNPVGVRLVSKGNATALPSFAQPQTPLFFLKDISIPFP